MDSIMTLFIVLLASCATSSTDWLIQSLGGYYVIMYIAPSTAHGPTPKQLFPVLRIHVTAVANLCDPVARCYPHTLFLRHVMAA